VAPIQPLVARSDATWASLDRLTSPNRPLGIRILELSSFDAEFDRTTTGRDELAFRFRPLAEYLARRFAGRGEPVEDLIQVASIGLLNAIDRFDPGRQVSFFTYATPTIIGELKRHLRDRGWALKVPRRLKESGLRMNGVANDLGQELGRPPTVMEIAARAGRSEEEVLEAMDVVHAYSTASLDAPTEDVGMTLAHSIAVEDANFELLEGLVSAAPLIKDLPQRERHILYLRFFREMTQAEIAGALGISQMHVSRLLTQMLEHLHASWEAASTPPRIRPRRVPTPTAPAPGP
jgi:RNA polymerase sigma-B factor